MTKLRILDLFSGIGGFSLGLERTGGFETVAFCEIEPFPRRVLAKHWPGVPIYEDVTKLTGDILARDGIAVDVITGGFPCQDISTAGKQAGMSGGTRSGLWSEIVRLIGELSPRYVIVENVANLLSGPSEKRGGWFGRVLGDLAECGYDAEWENIPAAALGAPHRRERVWIVAYPSQDRRSIGGAGDFGRVSYDAPPVIIRTEPSGVCASGSSSALADTTGEQDRGLFQPGLAPDASAGGSGGGATYVSDPDEIHAQGQQPGRIDAQGWSGQITGSPGPRIAGAGGQWRVEPDVGRVVARISSGLDGGRLNGKPRSDGTGQILQAMRAGDDTGYVLPPIDERMHIVSADRMQNVDQGMLFRIPEMSATSFHAEKKLTLKQRCDLASELANHDAPVTVWCETNEESTYLTKAIDGAIEVRGDQDPDEKERRLLGFQDGQYRAIVCKPKLAGFGVNWQHCAHAVFASISFSYEQHYQAKRRSHRFGQSQRVRNDVVMSDTEASIWDIINVKSEKHDEMKRRMSVAMGQAQSNASVRVAYDRPIDLAFPEWIKGEKK